MNIKNQNESDVDCLFSDNVNCIFNVVEKINIESISTNTHLSKIMGFT